MIGVYQKATWSVVVGWALPTTAHQSSNTKRRFFRLQPTPNIDSENNSGTAPMGDPIGFWWAELVSNGGQ
jgi:hypothetical protein